MKPCCKGSEINYAKKYLLKTFGPYAINRIAQQLDAEDANILTQKSIIASEWLPEKTYVNLLATAEKIYGKGDYGLPRKIGGYIAKEGVPRLYKIFIRFGNPVFVLQNAARFYRQLHTTGTFEITSHSSTSAVGCLKNFELPNKAFCAVLMGFSQSVFELCGAKNVSIHEIKCVNDGAEYCEYIASWE